MIELNKWMFSAGTLILFILFSFIAIYILNKIAKITSKKFSLDSRILKTLGLPIRLGIVLVGILVANYYLDPSLRINGINLVVFYKIAALFIFIIASARTVKTFFVWYVENLKNKKHVKIDDTIFQFLTKITSVVLYVVALLISLSILGIEIKPILAGLGIAGLAVALALQDTLGNFFSAIYIAVDQPVKIGDFIEISTGEKGYVMDIGWRSTRLRTRDNNIVIVPNSKLSQAVITNYNQVHSKFKVEVEVGVSYKSDLELVEKVTVNTAKKIMKELEPGIKDFEPHIRYDKFADSSINLRVALMTEDVERKFVIIHRFIKSLAKEYKKNNIEIPYPQRDVHLSK